MHITLGRHVGEYHLYVTSFAECIDIQNDANHRYTSDPSPKAKGRGGVTHISVAR